MRYYRSRVVVGIEVILGKFTVKAESINLGPFAILACASSLGIILGAFRNPWVFRLNN